MGYPDELEKRVILEDVNRGKRPVKITGFSILLPNKMKIITLQPEHLTEPLPAMLTDGASISVSLSIRRISKQMIESGFTGKTMIRAQVSSPKRKKGYVGKKITHDPEYWINDNNE